MLYELWLDFAQILTLIVHLLGVLNAVHAVLRVRSPQATVGWALALVLLPWIAIPLYWVFGRQKFIGYHKGDQKGDQPLDELTRQVFLHLQPFQQPLSSRTHHLGLLQPLTGNRVHLLINGEATFPAILEAIDNARDYILIQFFIVRDDRLGRELRERLIHKAGMGVRVYFLYDEVGSHELGKAYFDPLQQAGVKVEAFRTTRGPGNRFQLNFRNHRKLVVVDGRVALTGGLNVGVEYCGESPRFGSWRDTHAEVRGPAVQALQFAFIEDWHWATDELPSLCWEPAPEEADVLIQVAATGPADELDVCSLLFLDAIYSAREQLWITSPYLVPDPAVLSALQLAALRGVDVRIMLPSAPDHQLPWYSSFSYYEALHQAGVTLYRYQPGFLHQKVLLIDDDRAVVGSVNVDYRSFHLNFEMALVVRSAAFAQDVDAMLREDFSHCRKIDLAEPFTRWFRAKVRFARLFSPVQ